jgi:hypothetical protein
LKEKKWYYSIVCIKLYHNKDSSRVCLGGFKFLLGLQNVDDSRNYWVLEASYKSSSSSGRATFAASCKSTTQHITQLNQWPITDYYTIKLDHFIPSLT